MLVACALAAAPLAARGDDGATAVPAVPEVILEARAEVAEVNEHALEEAPAAVGATCRATLDVPGLGETCRTADDMLRVELRDGSSHTIHGLDAPPAEAGAYLPGSQARVNEANSSDVTCVDPSERHYVLVYARPSDVASRYDTIAPKLRSEAYRMSAFLDAESQSVDATKGKRLRFRCDGGVPVVQHATLSPKGGAGVDFGSVVSDLVDQGYQSYNNSSATARYVVFYDGPSASGAAGTGHVFRSDSSPGTGNLNNKGGLYAVEYTWSGGGGVPHWDVLLHETAHTMGAVVDDAPNATDAGHCNDGQDVMCYSDGGPASAYRSGACGSEQFDCGRNDYFNPSPAAGSWLASHWNVAAPANLYLDHRFLGDTLAPTLPGGLVQTGASNTAVGIAWTASSDDKGVAGYTIQVRAPGGTWQAAGSTNRVSASVGALAPTTGYEVSVAAFDAAGNTGPAATLSVATNDQPDLQAPQAPSGATVALRNGVATFSWSDAGDNVGVRDFELRRLVVSSTDPTLRVPRSAGTTPNTTLPVRTGGLTPGVTYLYEVVARDDASNVSPGAIVRLTMPRDTTRPGRPLRVFLSARHRTAISMRWTRSSDNVRVARYRVYRQLGRRWVQVRVVPAFSQRTTVLRLRRGTPYAFRVRAQDTSGNLSAFSPVLRTRTR